MSEHPGAAIIFGIAIDGTDPEDTVGLYNLAMKWAESSDVADPDYPPSMPEALESLAGASSGLLEVRRAGSINWEPEYVIGHILIEASPFCVVEIPPSSYKAMSKVDPNVRILLEQIESCLVHVNCSYLDWQLVAWSI